MILIAAIRKVPVVTVIIIANTMPVNHYLLLLLPEPIIKGFISELWNNQEERLGKLQ